MNPYSTIQKLFLILLLLPFSISILVLSSAEVSAQSVGFKVFSSEIKNSGAYYWGLASSEESMRVAENDALGQLLGQIAVNVSSTFEHNISSKRESIDISMDREYLAIRLDEKVHLWNRLKIYRYFLM